MATPSLLFVCVENSARSQMAEGFARALGRGMKEKGVDLASQQSKSLDSLPDQRWDYVVTMGCGDACPHLPANHRVDWDLPDPKKLDDAGYRSVRDQIEKLVGELINLAETIRIAETGTQQYRNALRKLGN